ncbi:hypothetical protein DMC01_06895 [Campylobacter troglodytis]|nr:hypothetical protein DMC01_06895 [Campylobacter troglodytis]
MNLKQKATKTSPHFKDLLCRFEFKLVCLTHKTFTHRIKRLFLRTAKSLFRNRAVFAAQKRTNKSLVKFTKLLHLSVYDIIIFFVLAPAA